MPAHIPHKQLKKIRHRLGITQKQTAAILGVSHQYFLSVETGQRDLSKPLAARIAKTFGVARIEDKDAEPMLAVGGDLKPFSRELYEVRSSTRPSFFIEEDEKVVRPTVADYARCAHALLRAAEKEKQLAPAVNDFLEWSKRTMSTDAIFEKFRESFEELFPGQRRKSEAFLVVTANWGRHLEREIVREDERRTKRNARQRKKSRL